MRRRQSVPGIDARAPAWAQDFQASLQQYETQRDATPTPHPQFYIAKLPPAEAWEGSTVYVLDTKRFAGSNGVIWRYLSDEAAV